MAGSLLGWSEARAQGRTAEGDFSGLVVRGLKFEGNRTYADELLVTVIATTNSTWFATFPVVRKLGFGEKRRLDELEFRRDVLRLMAFYREGGFLDAQVDTAVRRTPKDAYITFRVREGVPVLVDTFAIRGLEGLSAEEREEVTQDLPLEPGMPFDRRAMLATGDTLVARLRDRGRPSAQLFRNFTVDRLRRRANLDFEVDVGPAAVVGPSLITWQSGTQEVDSGVVRRLLVAQPGQTFRQRDLTESQRILYRTELFRFAAVDVDTTRWVPGDTVVPIGIRVVEARFHRVRAAAGYGTNDCLRGGASWAARNWLGDGRVLELSARASKIGVGEPADWGFEDGICPALKNDSVGSSLLNYSTAIGLRHPGLFSPFNTQTTSLFAERRSEWKVYLREEVGASLSLRRETPRRIPVTVTYRIALGQTTAPAITFCAFFNACTTDDVVALRERRRLATLGLLIAIPRANDPLDPTRGANYSFETVWSDRLLGSSELTEFTRLQADLAWYRPLVRGVTFAWRVRGGLLFSPRAVFDSGAVAFIPPDQRFYAGGPNDVRGYGRNELGPVVYTAPASSFDGGGEVIDTLLGTVRAFPSGGNTFAVANAELRVPSPILPGRVRFAFFVDAGTLLERGKVALAPARIRVTPGAGIRIATPLGPARVDVGYNSYERSPGPLYRVETNGDLTLVKDAFSTPRGSRFTFHIAVGQAF